MIKKIITRTLNSLGYELKKNIAEGSDEYAEFRELYDSCKEFTMTSIERMFALYKSVEYVVKNNIEGDFVECGVWRGGSAMLMAKTLLKFNRPDKTIYLYDTFEGMSTPTEKDIEVTGAIASELMNTSKKEDKNSVWCFAGLDDVKNNMTKTGYPASKIIYVKGKIEDTVPANSPQKISLLRLDTDWYESTLHEMNHLYPLLSTKGVLILDDYGHWQGAKQAVDEYFSSHPPLLLNRIDYTGRIAVKV